MSQLPIDAEHWKALLNLHRRQQGQEVGFINIASARALTDLGLALRTPQGWRITQAGMLLTSDAG